MMIGARRDELVLALTVLAVATLAFGGCGGEKEPRGVRLVQVTSSVPAGGESGTEPDDVAISARRDTTVIWIDAGRARAVSRSGDFLVQSDTGLLYQIHHADSTVTALRLSDLGTVPEQLEEEAASASPGQRKRIEAVLGLGAVKMTVRPTAEYGEFDGYRCRKYLVEMTMGEAVARSEYWVTRDIDVDRRLFRTLTHAAMLKMPGSEAVLHELDKLDGLPVVTTGTVEFRGHTTRTSSRLVDVAFGPIPREILRIPAGYTVVRDSLPFGP